MIISTLTGGLGNQMFQYAIAKNMSILKRTDCAIDINSFTWDTLRKYELFDVFDINSKIATNSDIENIKLNHKYSILSRLKRKIQGGNFPYYLNAIVKEQFLNYDSNIKKINTHCILEGYWQSEKYFNTNSLEILKDFTFKNNPNEYYTKIIDELLHKNTISIHIRRGDYVHNNSTNVFHGTCSLNYYNKAIDVFFKKVKNPVFVIISDDIEWCKTNMAHISNCIFIENNKGEDYEDLRIMSMCKHNIIANSSFSWWGAWLNQNPQKIVVAPKLWFANAEMQAQTQDLIPESWITL